MSVTIDRRLLLKAGVLGLGALATPGIGQLLGARGFTHNVASGEPGPNSVLLWTRYVPEAGGRARLDWQVAADEGFGRIVASGSTSASEEHDFCVKPVAGGLAPGHWYYYRFRDAGGRFSPVGRTRTLPVGPTAHFTIGFFSCSNLGFGWFNAYGHAAARRDLDLIAHVGDYLYEYQQGRYPGNEEGLPERRAALTPATEIVRLADYRLRYAAYRADPDLQRLHQMFPMVAMWDDHESANNSWVDGAQNHQPDSEGSWAERKAAAMQAYREWLPVSGRAAWADYEIGDLATLFRPETRLTARSRELTFAGALRGQADRAAALAAFRDTVWRDPARTLMGAGQEAWLAAGLHASVQRGAKWQVLAQQVLIGTLAMPNEAREWAQGQSDGMRNVLLTGLDAANAGLPFGLDGWDGFPAARARLLRASLDAGANLVVLTGDTHNGWAFDLDLDGTPVGVELGGQSVTSPGYEDELPNVRPDALARAVIARNPQLKWADTSHRGYATLTLTPAEARGEWLFMDTIRQRSTRLADRHAMRVAHGSRRFAT